MKTTQEQHLHDVRGDDYKTIKMRVDDSKLGKLYGMLSNIYRNPIGSIVREYTSNAHDANIEAHNFKSLQWSELCMKYPWLTDPNSKLKIDEAEYISLKANLTKAGKNEPIVVGVDRDKMEFYVKDYGIGLSPQRMEHVFFTYLTSTKEDTNDEIGGFGIGAKSALAYTNTFFITTVYNGMQYDYMMTKNEEGLPVGKEISSKSTTDYNGTVIRIPIKEWSEMVTFVSEIEKKLLYIPNIYYHGWDKCKLNDFKLYKGSNWVYSNSGRHDQMHVVLDNVPYDIDWTELGMKPNMCPLGLTFNTGELIPTPARESLLYSKKTKDLLKERIKDVQDFFYSKIDKQNKPTDDLMKAWVSWRHKGKYFYLDPNKKDSIDLEKLLENDTRGIPSYSEYVPFIGSGLKMSDFTDYRVQIAMKPVGELDIGANAKWTTYAKDTWKSQARMDLNTVMSNLNSSRIIFAKQALNQTTAHYFAEKVLTQQRRSLKDAKGNIFSRTMVVYTLPKRRLSSYKKMLTLDKVGKDRWRKRIAAYQAVEDYLVSKAWDGNVIPDPTWERLYRAGKTLYSPKATYTVPTGQFSFKIYNKYIESSSSHNKTCEAKDLAGINHHVIYGDGTQTRELKFIRDILWGRQSRVPGKAKIPTIKGVNDAVDLVAVYKKDITIINQLDMENWHYVDDVMKKGFKAIERVATANFINRGMAGMHTGNYVMALLNKISPELSEDIDFLNKYIQDNLKDYSNAKSYKNGDGDLMDYITEQHRINNSFDYQAIQRYNRVIKAVSRSVALGACLESFDYSVKGRDLGITYTWARSFRSDGIPVQEKFYNRFLEYALYEIIENTDEINERYLTVISFPDFTGEQTCLAEDEMGTEKYRQLLIANNLITENEKSIGGSDQNVQSEQV